MNDKIKTLHNAIIQILTSVSNRKNDLKQETEREKAKLLVMRNSSFPHNVF